MSELNDFFKQLAEERAKDPVYQKKKQIEEQVKKSVKTDISGLFNQLAEEKAKDPVYQKNKQIEEQVKKSVKSDLGSLFSELASLKNKKQEIIEENPELVDAIEEPIVEEPVAEEPIVEAAPLPTPVGLVPVEQQVEPEVTAIDKYLKSSSKEQEETDVASSAQLKELNDINKKIKFIEQWIGKIQNTGPGSGEVNFRYLDDVDRSTIMDGNFLTYNASTRKFEFREVAGGSGGGTPQVQSDWNVTDDTLKSYIKNKPTLFDGAYASLSGKPTLFSGSYTDLTNKPVIPTVPTLVSAFTNDAGYLTSVSWTDVSGKPTLFSGSYTDLTNKPTLFSGSYTDLTNKPTIPSLTGYATEAFVNTAITNLIGAAPTTLDTLKEIADQLATDESAVSSLTTTVAGKVSLTGSYANPAWITSLAYSKLTGAPTIPTTTSQLTNNSGYVANTSGAYIELIDLGIATMRANDHVMLQAAGYGWSFRLDGKLEFPDNTMQTTAWTGSVAYSSVTGKPTVYSSAYIGTTSLDFTRASGAQTLNGVSISGNAGTVTNGVYTTDTGTVTNAMLAGNIANAKLLNSRVTIGSTVIDLGTTASNLEGLNSVTATTFSGTLAGAAPASYLSGTTLNSTVVNSSLTSVGTLAGLRTTGHNNFGTNTYTKAGYGTGDISLDNGTTDTPGLLMYYGNNNNFGVDSYNGTFSILSGQLFRITNNLNESGGAVKMAIDTTGNMVTTGFVQPSAWRPGQVIRDTMLSNTEFTVNTTTVATSTTDTDFITYSYTPTSNSSYLIIHVHVADYRAASDTGGAGTDSYFSRIKVDGNEIVYSRQMTRSNEGGRTGSLFPLTGRYTNSNTTAKTITVGVRRDSADDNITIVNSATALSMRITEIAR